jgi:hypothetical protein
MTCKMKIKNYNNNLIKLINKIKIYKMKKVNKIPIYKMNSINFFIYSEKNSLVL